MSPVVLLHKRIGGDRGEADADEEVDEEVGDEAKVEDCSQRNGDEVVPPEVLSSHFYQVL